MPGGYFSPAFFGADYFAPDYFGHSDELGPPTLAFPPLQLRLASASIVDQGGTYDRKYTRTYWAFFPTHFDEHTVLANCGILINSPHPTAPRAYAKSISASDPVQATDVSTPCLQWSIAVEYGLFAGSTVPGGPLAQPAVASLVSYFVEEPAYRDFHGTPILNTAGDPYFPALPYTRTRYRLRVRKNLLSPDFGSLLSLNGRTNDAPWLLWDAECVKVEPIEIPEVEFDESSGQHFHPMTFEFDIDEQTWQAQIPSMGTRENLGGILTRMTDEKGEEMTDPVMLDASGKRLTYPATAESIVIQKFTMNGPISFAPFDVLGEINF